VSVAEYSTKKPLSATTPTRAGSHPRVWLFSRRADFWLAAGGASLGLLAASLLLLMRGDRELDALDFVLSELHLGATYHAIVQRRLWRRRQIDVVVVPLVIVALTYTLSITGQAILITSIAMYAAVWHRGRQNLGVARFYQSAIGGPISRTHEVLFRGAIYLPMFAAIFAYTHLSPTEYEGDIYLALNLGAEITAMVGVAAALWVITYLGWAFRQNHSEFPMATSRGTGCAVHPGEWWIVLAHSVAFGSAYALGASTPSFLLVLAVHHEVQYLYFTYAMSRRTVTNHQRSKTRNDAAPALGVADAPCRTRSKARGELRHAGYFLFWPVIGFSGAMAGGWLELEWLAPLGMGGLFCHYWLDARIWRRR
jgi:hypothetical protein